MSTLEIVAKNRPLRGEIMVPGDKSISHRAVMLGSLAEGETEIEGFLMSEDCLRTVTCFQEMGVPIQITPDQRVHIQGVGRQGLKPPKGMLDAGNSGTTMRLLAGIVAGQRFSVTITGDASLCKRPMDRIAVPLREMCAEIRGEGERVYPPLTIEGGHLIGINYHLPVASAQVKSALLLAGLNAMGVTRVVEPVPSRDHTERLFDHFGIPLDYEYKVDGVWISVCGQLPFKGKRVVVPGDISSAAYFMVAATLIPGSELLIRNVGVNPTRAAAVEMLRQMGGNIELKDLRQVNGEYVSDILVRSATLHGIDIQGRTIPILIDELPILALAAACAYGETNIRDAVELRVKESDRIAVMVRELKRVGADIEERYDGMVIHGRARLRRAACQSEGDHRVAMTMAIAALVAEEEGMTQILDADCIETSFPHFSALLEKI